jgi:glutamyl-tRNA reductase
MEARGARPLLMIDLAVPRDIDPACAALPGVSLHDIDALQAVVARNRSVRQAEAVRAQALVEEEIGLFADWLGSLEVLPTLSALRERAAEIAQQVVAENESRWESASPADRRRVEALARTIVNRILHEPTVRMKGLGASERAHVRMQVVRELFGLEDEDATGSAESGASVHPLPRRTARS